ncbi:hypothetical protein IVA87_09955 [Bradyrhizobium sp. 147]|uniref:hypothetical protein n=1 Tax=unclassified Bradyrhizobium TaxID=2631580 RepID=UPI001FF8C05D|nr:MULTISPECIES: hypothetical protein [unclassified Bradyrhizobium]MCK1544085.1 hypothetical protein [Bradyrhizobium sp. 179]MCK1624434.1 hypothetical protein [Bradyrhizobium sp. 160]MCK1679761.1 hypothetical protein [Bradyrhizobium sp. 147]
MIRKPAAAWTQRHEDGAVRTIRTASALAKTSYSGARRAGKAVVGLICYFFAAIWGFAALASGLAGSLPSLVGIGAMAAFMFWAGRRSFAAARAA